MHSSLRKMVVEQREHSYTKREKNEKISSFLVSNHVCKCLVMLGWILPLGREGALCSHGGRASAFTRPTFFLSAEFILFRITTRTTNIYQSQCLVLPELGYLNLLITFKRLVQQLQHIYRWFFSLSRIYGNLVTPCK